MNTSISSVVQETGDIAGTNRAYSNRRDKKNKHSSSQEPPVRIRKERRRRNKERFLYNEYK